MTACGTLGRHVQDAAVLARACVVELRERGWDGDDELADQLDGLLGAGATPLLRPLPVNLEELAGALEGDPLSGSGRLDLQSGRCGLGRRSTMPGRPLRRRTTTRR